jgi:hypothetical protein
LIQITALAAEQAAPVKLAAKAAAMPSRQIRRMSPPLRFRDQ